MWAGYDWMGAGYDVMWAGYDWMGGYDTRVWATWGVGRGI